MNEECIFCKIVNGEVPSYKVFENEGTVAILDGFPEMDGHTLVIPKKHCENIFDADKKTLEEVIEAARQVSLLMKENFGVDGVNVANNSGKDAGQVVSHLHFHILPRFENDGKDLKSAGEKSENKNFEEILSKIKGEKNESE
jgi:histidine triad (HIT) family protein